MEMAWCSERGLPHSELLEWDDEDRAKLHAFLLEEATRCVMCGTQPWEWQENPRAYDAEEIFCKGCYIRAMASDDHDAPKGTTIQLVPASKSHLEAKRERYLKSLERMRRDKSEG
jgi:hypothetical protein